MYFKTVSSKNVHLHSAESINKHAIKKDSQVQSESYSRPGLVLWPPAFSFLNAFPTCRQEMLIMLI